MALPDSQICVAVDSAHRSPGMSVLTTASKAVRTTVSFALLLFVGNFFSIQMAHAADAQSLRMQPEKIELNGIFSVTQILVSHPVAGGQDPLSAKDVTSQATFTSEDENVAMVNAKGLVVSRGNGQTNIVVQVQNKKQTIPVVVKGFESTPQVNFNHHILPLISRLGCNNGACHASQYGKGGLILSVLGFDPAMDFDAIVHDRRQRRVNFQSPEASLILQKPTLDVTHGGGQKLKKDSLAYEALLTWIATGAAGPGSDAPKIVQLAVSPKERLVQPGERQQLRAVASYSDGSQRDVTHLCKFDSLDESVVVTNEDGLVDVKGQGQTSVMVRFEGASDIAIFVAPYGSAPPLADWQPVNFIDELAAKKFQELGIAPSPICDDATFHRRAFLDAIGTLPTAEETEKFLADSSPDKRTRLIDRLLGLTNDPLLNTYNDQYAAYWSLKWSDLLRNSSSGQATDEQRMWAMHNWIKDSLRVNKPFDQFVRELVTAKGSIFSSGPASYFQIFNNSSDLAESTAQIFLGIRLQCAKCHHHPFEHYSQEDYYSFAAFFSRVGNKSSQEFGLFGRETVVMVKTSGDVRHPKTGKVLQPKPPMADPMDHPLDRRIPLSEWLTSPENPNFARNIANRYFAYLMGRGLVEPVDDLRGTNPPTNPALLDALTQHFVESNFDLKQLVRVIMTSRLYQVDSSLTPENASDEKFYTHYRVKRLPAEPLLDAIDYVTQVQTKFKGLPLGTRAIELPDGEYPDYFLATFGKPKRVSVCECERVPDENLGQVLHTLNGDILAKKLADKNGRISKLVASDKTNAEKISELYMIALCRPATQSEVATALTFMESSPSPTIFFEDLLWTLINSKGFLFIQ